MVLPGTAAKKTRARAAKLLKRHFAGDQSLHAEINANHASSSLANTIFRDPPAAGDGSAATASYSSVVASGSAEGIAEQVTGKGASVINLAANEVNIVGYIKDPRSVAAKGQRRLMPVFMYEGKVVLPLDDLIRWVCVGETDETMQECYDRACKNDKTFTPLELDFTLGHLRNPEDTVLCSNCMHECAQSLRCGPCMRRCDFHIFYCSKECQLAAWPAHKLRCFKNRC